MLNYIYIKHLYENSYDIILNKYIWSSFFLSIQFNSNLIYCSHFFSFEKYVYLLSIRKKSSIKKVP